MDADFEHILIAGGTGFLGQILQQYFERRGCEVRLLSRGTAAYYTWDGEHQGDWVKGVEWADVVINLSGKSVDCRYTKRNRQLILSSRLNTTKAIGQAIENAKNPPKVWLNASSATIYVHSETTQMTEDEGIIGDDFSMNVCKQWEKSFFSFQLNRTRKVALRTSIVLGKSGGAYPQLERLVKWRFGGMQGNGDQLISWIHEEDFCRAVEFCISQPQIVGPINVTSPHPIANADFMRLLREVSQVNIGLNQSKWLLELGAAIIGTETELLLKSRNVYPERLLENGFEFNYDSLHLTFKSLSHKLAYAF